MIANLRWIWRQLTSMRTALILLFLLALASIPGSLFPQRGTSPLRVNQFLRDNPTTGPILDRLYFFDVFASPWFGAVYLLLFVSLIGCVVPRLKVHWNELRALPPVAPHNLTNLAGYNSWSSKFSQEEVLTNAKKIWRSAGWRIRVGENWVAAERGFIRETGNLLFHLSLLLILVAVGFGSADGYRGTVIVRENSGFANNLTQYDSFAPGRIFDPANLPPFSFVLDDFFAEYQRGGMQNGSALAFRADVTLKRTIDAPDEKVTIEVNEPLRIAGSTVYLVGHGYAPKFIVRNSDGDIVWEDAAVFLPQDGLFTSTGVVKVPDTVPQIGVQGFFLPTASDDFTFGPKSDFPAADNPAVFITAWKGDLGLDDGIPQSVYQLNTTKMTQLGIEDLKPGEVWELPQDTGTVEFAGFVEWASFSITKDSGKSWALLAAVFAIAGLTLSLLIPRRRAWLRVSTDASGNVICEVAGLAKNETPGLVAEIQKLSVSLQ